MDLENLMRSWEFSLRAEHLSPNYVRGCLSSLRTYISAGHTTLNKSSVAKFISTFSDPGTANLRARHLKRFSTWLFTEEETTTDVLAGLKPPTPREKLVEKLSDADVEKMLRSCPLSDFHSRRDAALLLFGLDTGARASEVLDMKIEDLDMKRMIAVITRGKGGRGRIVPFGYVTARALDKYLRARKKHPYASSEWLWLGSRAGNGGKNSAHLQYNAMSVSLRTRAKTAGVEGFHYHLLRHTFASNWLRKGGSEGGLCAIAGWNSRLMLDRYVRDTAAERAIEESRRLQA